MAKLVKAPGPTADLTQVWLEVGLDSGLPRVGLGPRCHSLSLPQYLYFRSLIIYISLRYFYLLELLFTLQKSHHARLSLILREVS